MSSRAARPLTGEFITRREISRRDVVKLALGVVATAAGASLGKEVYDFGNAAYDKFQSIGHDYSNDPFLRAVGAVSIGQARLDELLNSDIKEKPVLQLERTDKSRQVDPTNLAEFTFMQDTPGPAYLSFDGIEATNAELVVLKVSVDEGEDLYAPIVRGPNKESPSGIQLGLHDDREHRLDISIAYSPASVSPEEIIPNITIGQQDTIESYINRHQPEVYLRRGKSVGHNTPLRSLVFVQETDDDLALVYWTECLGEDLEYGYFGTTVEQLIETKNRPTDYDWNMEALVSKYDGSLRLANIATPYHNRVPLSIDPSYTSHTPLRIASSNNNVVAANRTNSPKFRPLPEIYIHDARRPELYSTGKDTATLSLREHRRRGNISLNESLVLNYINSLGIDLRSLKS
jgi:hypothetical protein